MNMEDKNNWKGKKSRDTEARKSWRAGGIGSGEKEKVNKGTGV